ncbi:protein GDAP2 homolog [Penaeus monodon]|uniref:protein GDAP2 homolog n=1 Tax=Penaeus monodon TaxID=6687 RepID=UPI0018A7C50D|nr:protein GDAP2 homolog [Penaeus monodon]XP_037774431.1 protein GDAP2 homolog [Penaeus monodon]XP_037774437.1 protein GDAP2 homolog [Penaeus monodon]
MEPLGVKPQVVDVWSLPTWAVSEPGTPPLLPPQPTPNHAMPPFRISKSLNNKICLWNGDITCLNVEAIVHSTNESLNERSATSERLLYKAGSGLKYELAHNIKSCKTGEVCITDGYSLPARYVIHTVGPRYNIKYQTAAESALHYCYRRTLECAREKKIRTIAFCPINSVRRGFPPDQGGHIALRTVRRFLERFSQHMERIVFVVNSIDVSIYEILLPLYFPRTMQDEDCGCYLLPNDLGDELGEPLIPDRQIRIIDNPQHKYEDLEDSADLAAQFQSSVSIGDHAFSQMEEDIDKQRLLGGQPAYATADPETASMTSDLQHKQRYERLLRRAKTEDLSEVSGIGCLYQCGVDKFGRPVIIFIGKWFKFNEINLEKAILYLIYLLDPLVRGDYVIVYFHTITTTENHPSLAWIREVYEVLEYKYKKNLKAFYIVHPTLWTKIMTWWFTTFMAPQIKHKVHSVPGVEYLYDIIDQDQLEIPAYITEHDMTVNGIRYYKPGSASS